MKSFILCGYRNNKRRAFYVHAENAPEALAKANEDGYDRLLLVSDDMSSSTTTPAQHRRVQKRVPAWAMLRIAEGNRRDRTLGIVFLMLSKMWLSVVVLLGLIAMNRLSGRPFGPADIVLTSLLIVPLILMVSVATRTTAFERIEQAMLRGRWDQALSLLGKARKEVKMSRYKPGELDLARKESVILCRMGRTEEGVALARTLRDQEGVSEFDAAITESIVFASVEMHDEALDAASRAAELEPDRPHAWIMIAESGAASGQPDLARDALATARTLPMSVLVEPVLAYVEGCVANCAGEHEIALTHLARFREWAAGRQHMSSTVGLDAYAAAQQVIALGSLGRLEDAKRLYDGTVRFLIVQKQSILRVRCEAALGMAAKG